MSASRLHQQLLCHAEKLIVSRWWPGHRRAQIMPLRLPCRQRHPTLIGEIAGQVQVVVVHGRQLLTRAVEMTIRRRDASVVIEAVFMPLLEATDPEATTRNIRVNVVVVNVVVTLEVTFQPVCSVHEKIVMCVEVLRGIVIVNGLMAVVVREHKILRDFGWGGCYRLGETVADGRDVELSSPRVERAVISRLSAAVENQVAEDVIISAELIIEIAEQQQSHQQAEVGQAKCKAEQRQIS